MRTIVMLCAVCGLACCASTVAAQDEYEGWEEVSERPRTPLPVDDEVRARQLVRARAAEEARQRSARIEARRWLGISMQRPRYRHESMMTPPYPPFWMPYHAPAPRVIIVE